jgi:hypothetical protein
MLREQAVEGKPRVRSTVGYMLPHKGNEGNKRGGQIHLELSFECSIYYILQKPQKLEKTQALLQRKDSFVQTLHEMQCGAPGKDIFNEH